MDYLLNPRKLEQARGKLIDALGRDVNWREFATLCHLSEHAISKIRNGHSQGSYRTVKAITDMLRAHGVAVDETFFMQPAGAAPPAPPKR